MNIYYTAKDIEEMAGRGIRQIEIGPGITLTDFARETANQLGVTLVTAGQSQLAPQSRPSQPAPPSPAPRASQYNKPSGCMHGSSSQPAARSQGTAPSSPAADSSGTVNRLIDLMGKAINRG